MIKWCAPDISHKQISDIPCVLDDAGPARCPAILTILADKHGERVENKDLVRLLSRFLSNKEIAQIIGTDKDAIAEYKSEIESDKQRRRELTRR